MEKRIIVPNGKHIDITWINVRHTRGISINFPRDEKRRTPYIRGTFEVRIDAPGIEPKTIEGVWHKMIYGDDHGAIVLDDKNGTHLTLSQMESIVGVNLTNDLFDIIIDAIQKALIEEKRVLEVALSS